MELRLNYFIGVSLGWLRPPGSGMESLTNWYGITVELIYQCFLGVAETPPEVSPRGQGPPDLP